MIRWDKVNSKNLIQQARSIYFSYLLAPNSANNPKGVVLNQKERKGRIVFSLPSLLPNEHYLPIEQILKKTTQKAKRVKQ